MDELMDNTSEQGTDACTAEIPSTETMNEGNE